MILAQFYKFHKHLTCFYGSLKFACAKELTFRRSDITQIYWKIMQNNICYTVSCKIQSFEKMRANSAAELSAQLLHISFGSIMLNRPSVAKLFYQQLSNWLIRSLIHPLWQYLQNNIPPKLEVTCVMYNLKKIFKNKHNTKKHYLDKVEEFVSVRCQRD